MLEVNDLHVAYGNIDALHGVSFRVDKGEIVTLIGPNGAGKTTTLYALARCGPPEGPKVKAGDIIYKGLSLLRVPAHHVVAKQGIALVPEGRRIFGNLSVADNLKLATYARHDPEGVAADEALVFDLFTRLFERKKQRADSLSGGEQQMLAVGRAIMTGADFILLDEPSMGLAPLLMYDLFRTLKRLNAERGLTILVVEQNAKLALSFAHRAYVLDTGRIVAEGSCAEIAHDPMVKKAYLGG